MRLKQLLAKFNKGINLGGIIKKLTTQHSQSDLLNTRRISINLIAAIIVFITLITSVGVKGQNNPEVFVFPSAKNICIEIESNVIQTGTNLKYNYKIKSLNCSVQMFWAINLAVESKISNITVPVGWRKLESNVRYKIVRFSASNSNYFLDKNEEIDSLSFESQGLPIISNSYSYGYFPTPTFADGEGPEQVTNNDIYENAVIKRTIAPKTIPNPFDPLPFVDSMIEMGNEADTLGWIGKLGKEDQVWFNLKDKLNKVHIYIENENYNLAIDELDSFLTAVENYYEGRTKNLTNEGFALMKYNGEYLIKYLRALGN